MQNEVVLWQSCTLSSSEALGVYYQVWSIYICAISPQPYSLVRCSVLWIWFRKPLYNQHRISPAISTGLLTPPLLETGGMRAESAPV